MIFSNFWDSYFSSYGEFGEFSLRFTAAVSAVAQRSLSGRSAVAVFTKKAAHYIILTNRGRRLYSTARLFNPFNVAVVDFGPAWHCYSGQRAAYASGPTLRDRRDDEQRGPVTMQNVTWRR